jgi:putative transposase
MRWVWKRTKLTDKQKIELTRIASSRTQQSSHIERAKIVLACSEERSNTEISKDLNLSAQTINKWRERWRFSQQKLALIDEEDTGVNYTRQLLTILSDAPRAGTPSKFTAEQLCKIMSVACERPEDCGLPISHWSLPSLRAEIIKRGIVDNISKSRLAHFLK